MKNKIFIILIISMCLPLPSFAGTTIDGQAVETTNILNADQINMNPAPQEPTAFSEGSLYWDSLKHSLRGYDGLSWQDFQMGELQQDPWAGSNQETMDNLQDGYITFTGNNALRLKLDNPNDVTIESQKELILSSPSNIVVKPKLTIGDPTAQYGEFKINEWGDLEINSNSTYISCYEFSIRGKEGWDAWFSMYADAGGSWSPWFVLGTNKDAGVVECFGSDLNIVANNVRASSALYVGTLYANIIRTNETDGLKISGSSSGGSIMLADDPYFGISISSFEGRKSITFVRGMHAFMQMGQDEQGNYGMSIDTPVRIEELDVTGNIISSGTIQSSGGYKSSDGALGLTETKVFTAKDADNNAKNYTVTIKNGLITSWIIE